MKTTEEMIAVMQAYADGKEIESTYIRNGDDGWLVDSMPYWDWNTFDYRVKPEQPKPTYVPYESAEEFLAAMKEHGPYMKAEAPLLNIKVYSLPTKISDGFTEVLVGSPDEIVEELSFDWCAKNFVWQDGTPMGKEKGGNNGND